MRLILDEEKVIISMGENIVYARINAIDGKMEECTEEEAKNLWNRDSDIAYTKDVEVVELEVIPEEVKPFEYKYINDEFFQYCCEYILIDE